LDVNLTRIRFVGKMKWKEGPLEERGGLGKNGMDKGAALSYGFGG